MLPLCALDALKSFLKEITVSITVPCHKTNNDKQSISLEYDVVTLALLHVKTFSNSILIIVLQLLYKQREIFKLEKIAQKLHKFCPLYYAPFINSL